MDSESARPAVDTSPIHVDRWPTEIPLLLLVVLMSMGLWALFVFSIIGLFYAMLIGAFVFFAHVAFIAHLRGSAVRLGPDQFPELWNRVQLLARRAGMQRVPETYLLQAGGSLNALATRFLGARMIVLFSDLLEACGEDEAARDMVIGHELGHVKARHLDFLWLLAPGMLVPFLGGAYSRAREYTCDRWGAALCGDRESAVRGLAILAAGGTHGPQVNLESFVRQSSSFDGGWMTLGKWLSTHPPLCERVAALEPQLGADARATLQGPVRAMLLLGSLAAAPVAIVFLFSLTLIPMLAALGASSTRTLAGPVGIAEEYASNHVVPADLDPATARAQIDADWQRLVPLVRDYHATNGELPYELEGLAEAWWERYPEVDWPHDPYDGYDYGYAPLDGAEFLLFSSGPDGEPQSEDDIDEVFTVGG